MALMFVVSLTATAFAGGGRDGGHRGGGHGGGGVSTGAAIGIGVGALILGTIIGANNQPQEAPVQYYAPQMYQQPVPAPSFMLGTCFPQGAYFPNGIVIVGRGFYPPGTQVTPGFCFF